MTPRDAYWFARDNPDCDIGKYQEIACQEPRYAFVFARDVPGADIEYCQKHVFKDLLWAHWFVKKIPEADIEYRYRFFKYLGKDIKRFILKEL